MNQVDSVCTEKTCLSHMYDTKVYNQNIEKLNTHKVGSFDSCYSKLKFYF